MHQRHHDLPKAWLHAVGAFLIRIQKRLFLVTFCSAWGWPLVVGIFKKCKWYTSVDSGAYVHHSKGSLQFYAILGTDQLWHDSVKCPFSKQTKQHVDTTTLSCLGPPVLSQRFQCCTSWSKKQWPHLVSSKAEQTCHTYFQQIAVNTRELPQQETFFCITLKKTFITHHHTSIFHHFSMVWNHSTSISSISSPHPQPSPAPRSTGMAMVCCCPMFTTMPWSKPWAHKAICACDTTWHPWGNMWKNPGKFTKNHQ